ncbi:MAG: phenylacetate--CoA ligase, partial [bacterium]|nr:phenylacetate--CoA ligase [bacterium]
MSSTQLEKLNRLLRTLRESNPFYSARLEATGIQADLESLGAFSERVPFTSKQELVDDQLKHPPYGTNLTFPLERYTRFSQTSGTTSTSMRWLDTPESWQWMLDCWKRVYRSAGVTAADHILFAFSFGPFLGFWTAFDAGEQLGCLLV